MRPKKSIDRIALGAIIAAILAIIWAKVEILGTRDIERTLADDATPLPVECDIRRLEAVTMSRWAGGFLQ
jgi:hypothetical protein